MSKEALGALGLTVGSPAYFSYLQFGTMLSAYLPGEDSRDYFHAVSALGAKAREAVGTIYEDLRWRSAVLRYIPSERRGRLSEFVTALSGLCALVSVDGGPVAECTDMLSLTGLDSMTGSNASEWDLDRAAEIIRTGGDSGLDPFTSVSTVREAIQWGEGIAVTGDESKALLIRQLKHAQSSGFLEDAWNHYNYREDPGEFSGKNGFELGSDGYITVLERDVLPQTILTLPFQPDYAGQVRNELSAIIGQIESDVSTAERSNDYLADENGARLREAVESLARCGATADFGLERRIDQLCWYTPLDTRLVTELQRCLNRLDLSDLLMEDGVYGEKTSKSWNRFLDRISSGSVPTLSPIYFAQNLTTGLGVAHDIMDLGSNLYANTQAPDPFRTLGIQPKLPSTYDLTLKWDPAQNKMIHVSTHKRMNTKYIQISEKDFQFLKKFESAGKVIKIGGRVLLVANVILDALELGLTMEADLTDADGKLGKSTLRTGAGIAGRWIGSISGVKVGAIIGGLIGGIFAGPAFIIGAAAGAIVLGIFGAFAGQAFGEWIVDITCLDE